MVQRVPHQLEAVHAERPLQWSLRDLREPDRGGKKDREDEGRREPVPRGRVDEHREAQEPEDRMDDRGGQGSEVVAVARPCKDDEAHPEDRCVRKEDYPLNRKQVRGPGHEAVQGESDGRHEEDPVEDHESQERHQHGAPEVHAPAKAFREGFRDRSADEGGDRKHEHGAVQDVPDRGLDRRGICEEEPAEQRERKDREDHPPRCGGPEQPARDPGRVLVRDLGALRLGGLAHRPFTAATMSRRAPASFVCSTTVPVTRMSAPAFATAAAAAGVRIPPPTTRGIWIRSFTARTIAGGAGSGAPLPASRYTRRIPMCWAVRAHSTASSGLDRRIGSASPTSPARIPGSTIRYAIGIGSSPQDLIVRAALRCSPTMTRVEREFRRLMKYTASAWRERLEAPAGNRITGTFAAALIARTVPSTVFCVTPVDPPTMIASVFAPTAISASAPASAADCLSGSMRVMWTLPRETLSRM